jgi:O-antigen ligase
MKAHASAFSRHFSSMQTVKTRDVAPRARPDAVASSVSVDAVIFWLYAAALAWTPFWYGSNDLVAWGVNAVIFPGLAATYETSILVRGERHPVGVRKLALPAALFVAVAGWIWIQVSTWVPPTLAHPVWGMASEALEQPLSASISVNRDLTVLALVRLLTATSVLWLALQLCRDGARAILLIKCIAATACFYAAYGLIAFGFKAGRLPWLEGPSNLEFVSSTFINRNSFATYAGIGLIAMCGLILRLYRHQVTSVEGPRELRIASFIQATGEKGAALVAGAFLLVAALLLTGSRGGIIAAALGLFTLGALTFRRGKKRSTEQLETIIFVTLCVAVCFIFFGDLFVGNLAARGLHDTNRLAVALIVLMSILDAPFQGHGYGTFADVFPMYRDRSISVQGAWEQAHNTYLEIFQGLGLLFGSLLIAAVVLLVFRCINGATTRHGNVTVPRVAASVAILVGVHALVDFSLQIQAVTLTFMAILGAGVAQSESSRVALTD